MAKLRGKKREPTPIENAAKEISGMERPFGKFDFDDDQDETNHTDFLSTFLNGQKFYESKTKIIVVENGSGSRPSSTKSSPKVARSARKRGGRSIQKAILPVQD